MDQSAGQLTPLGGCIERAIAESWRSWKQENFPNHSTEDAWVAQTEKLMAEVQLKTAGRVQVSVVIQATKPHLSTTHLFRYVQDGAKGYKLTESSLIL